MQSIEHAVSDSLNPILTADLGRELARICEAASEVIMPLWRAEVRVDLKADQSPVTEADRAAEAVILDRLKAAYPQVMIVSEEAAAEFGTPESVPDTFFLVDPLDGTKGFVRGTEAFTVNIGLIHQGRPIAGAVAAPASGLVWYTVGNGAVRRRFHETEEAQIKARQMPESGGHALVSHTLTEEEADRIAQRHGCKTWVGMDSSVKFCLIAEGRADVYPRPGPTSEWDTAAAEAVLTAAGGRVLAEGGVPIRYGKADQQFRNLGFLALGA